MKHSCQGNLGSSDHLQIETKRYIFTIHWKNSKENIVNSQFSPFFAQLKLIPSPQRKECFDELFAMTHDDDNHSRRIVSDQSDLEEATMRFTVMSGAEPASHHRTGKWRHRTQRANSREIFNLQETLSHLNENKTSFIETCCGTVSVFAQSAGQRCSGQDLHYTIENMDCGFPTRRDAAMQCTAFWFDNFIAVGCYQAWPGPHVWTCGENLQSLLSFRWRSAILLLLQQPWPVFNDHTFQSEIWEPRENACLCILYEDIRFFWILQ